MTVQGMQQQLQSSVLMHEHLPGCGLMIDPAVEEMELAPEAGISAKRFAGGGLRVEVCTEARAGLHG
jgi:hypothetical protein